MSTKKIRLNKTTGVRIIGGKPHALEEGEELEVNDIPAGSDKPRFWFTDVYGKEIGIIEEDAEVIKEN